MRKFLCLLFVLLLIPLTGAAESPELKGKLHNSEDIQFELFDAKIAQEVYDQAITNEELVAIVGKTKPVEGFKMTLDTQYETVAWYFIAPIYQEKVFMVLIGESMYILEGTIEDNAVLFDFTDIEPGTYDVLVFYVK